MSGEYLIYPLNSNRWWATKMMVVIEQLDELIGCIIQRKSATLARKKNDL